MGYIIISGRISDKERFEATVEKAAIALHEKYGIKLLARTDHPTIIDGSRPFGRDNRLVLLEFPDDSRVHEWYGELSKMMEEEDADECVTLDVIMLVPAAEQQAQAKAAE